MTTPSPKSSLPEWIKNRLNECIPIEEEDIIEALIIAVEALERMGCDCYPQSLSGSHTSKCNFAQAKDALRRISSLGDGK